MLTTFDRASAHAPSSVSRLRLRSAVLAWMAALALAGCGGGGDDTTQTDTTTDSGAEASVERSGPSGHWIIDQDYNGFRLIYDCTDRTALHYRYTLQADTGSAARPSTFTFDPTLPAGCLQQTSTASYESVHPGYDRGHLVMSNHMDSDSALIRRANYMSNIVPQSRASTAASGSRPRRWPSAIAIWRRCRSTAAWSTAVPPVTPTIST